MTDNSSYRGGPGQGPTSTTTTATPVRKRSRAAARLAGRTRAADIRGRRRLPAPARIPAATSSAGPGRRLPPNNAATKTKAATPNRATQIRAAYPEQRGYQDQGGLPLVVRAASARLLRPRLRPGLPPGRRLAASHPAAATANHPAGTDNRRAAMANHPAAATANHRRPARLRGLRRLRPRTPRARRTVVTALPVVLALRHKAPPEPQRPAYPDQGAGYEAGRLTTRAINRVAADTAVRSTDQATTPVRRNSAPGGYPAQAGGYAEPARDYDYGQSAAPDYGQPAGGYGGYGQGGYGSPGNTVTLQLDDGSGRTYQLARRLQHHRARTGRPVPVARHRRLTPAPGDPLGRAGRAADGLNSTNGTTVNNAPVQEWQLADGDVIRLGHSEIIVRIH
ncbi:FHA domain protein [Mycobacterium kansasii 662]|uniref:FHA domain protein n=1 Tax=Mycobacterium kansasii 662 TaxID=1299326 RepID=X7Z1Q3_MYCKA|nr:FHA domain protein [Mycobacterium kansasii 662]